MPERDLAAEATRLDGLRAGFEASSASVRADLARLEARARLLMTARLAVFGVAVVGFFATVATADDAWTRLVMLPALAVFAVLVLVHRPVRRRIHERTRLLAILDRKLMRTGRERRGGPPHERVDGPDVLGSGAEPEGPTRRLPPHVLDDLGLVGRGPGVLALIDTCSCRLGRLTLASWFAFPLRSAAAVTRRQNGARRLLEERALRHAIERALAPLDDRPHDADLVFLREGEIDGAWLPGRIDLALSVALPLALVAAGLAFSSGLAFVAGVAAAGLANVRHRRALGRAPELRGALLQQAVILRAARELGALLPRGAAAGEALEEIAAAFATVTDHPRHPLGPHLARLGALRLYRAGLFYVAFSFFTLWDLWLLGPLLRHQRELREPLRDAFRALGRLDALRALATLAEEQSGWTWPDVETRETPRLLLEDAIHPLLPRADAVGNDIELNAAGPTIVVTGSNMSGKSTWLKTCGLAVACGQAGGPVRARRAVLTPMALASDMNVRDSLDDGRSYFAVEVDRIREMLELVADDPFALILLDEMFRGTNAHEKVAAGYEVTRWLAASGALAIVATHDREITAIAGDEPALKVRNAHFRDEIADGRMSFGYRLESGPARGSNAIRVLEARGFPPELVARALERSRKHDEGRG